MNANETVLTKFCIELFNSMPDAYVQKRMATILRAGEPDVTGILNKIRVEIEMKIYGNNPTEIQLRALKQWKDLGAISGWANSITSFIQIFDKEISKNQLQNIHWFLETKSRNRALKQQILDARKYVKELLYSRHNIFWEDV